MESLDKLFLDLSSLIYGEKELLKEKAANPEYSNDTSVSLLNHSPVFSKLQCFKRIKNRPFQPFYISVML